MLVFWKFLRMSLMDDPSFEYPVVNFVRMKGIEFIYQNIQRFFFMLSMILFHAPESFVYVLNG